MTETQYHPLLIRANLALYQGDTLAAQRLLDEYYQQHRDKRDDPLVLWLDAQTRTTPEERIEQLRLLVRTLPLENEYSQLAREYLADEERFEAHQKPPRYRWMAWQVAGVPLWLASLLTVTGGLFLYFFVSTLLQPPRPADTTNLQLTVSAQVAALPTRTPLPDLSTPVNVDDYRIRYTGGILEVGAIEPESKRVFNAGTGLQIQPVPGARFYALRLIFECRIAICNTPPEARLALRLDDNSVIPLRADVLIDGTTSMQPIALGRTTFGWYVFEIPVTSIITYLEIRPLSAAPEEPPLVILLQQS